MIKVQFNDVEEFFEELAKMVEAKIVRVTTLSFSSEKFPGVYYGIAAVAGAINGVGHIVELRVPCGTFMAQTSEGQPAIVKANELVETIVSKARHLGFDVRSGRFLVAEAGQC